MILNDNSTQYSTEQVFSCVHQTIITAQMSSIGEKDLVKSYINDEKSSSCCKLWTLYRFPYASWTYPHFELICGLRQQFESTPPSHVSL